MIISIKKAILHVLDGLSGIAAYSDEELDLSDAVISSFIIKHIERIYDEPGAREGEFNDASGFKYHLGAYMDGTEDFCKFTRFIAEKLYEGIAGSEKSVSSDMIAAECVIQERDVMVILKCDNHQGYIHKVVSSDAEDGKKGIRNEILNYYAILPTVSQKISEYAFIDMQTMKILCRGKKVNIAGESYDIIEDILLDCVCDISSKKSFDVMNKIAKKVSEDNGVDSIDSAAKIKRFVQENVNESEEFIEPKEFAEAVFDMSPSIRKEFIEEIEKANVPEKVKMNEYISKKAAGNIKIVTDKGIEISFPAEYYNDEDYFTIINNEDGTLSIRINNIGEIINKT